MSTSPKDPAMPQVRCPAASELESLFLGGRPAEELPLLEEHLLGCNACLETLKMLLSTRETLTELLRGAPPASTQGDSPVVTALLRTLRSLRTPASGSEPPGTAESATPDHTVSHASIPTPSGAKPAPTTAGTPCEPDPDTGEPENLSTLTALLSPPLAAGELGRLGKYRVLKVLGHGGMGVVYLAEDSQLKRVVALKAMRPDIIASAHAGQRFLREAQAMAALKHDHIVTIYQVDQEGSVPFLAMELLDGESLEERFKRAPVFSLQEVLRIGREVAEGLTAAHARGLIHRDIKPGNIWLEGARGRVKILDFGLARAATPEAGVTQQGAIIGTPMYMAPEQARGDPVEARSDLFSFGVVLYRLCTGRVPFQGKDTIATLLQVAAHEPPEPCRVNPEIPGGLSGLVMRLLEKDPERRPASAAEVIQTLQAVEAALGEKLPAARASIGRTPSQAVPTGRRRLAMRLAVVALAVGFVAVAAAALIRITTEQGDYVVETDDPEITFQVSKGTVTLRDTRAGRVYRLKVVRQDSATGEQELEVSDPDGDLAFQTRTFTIRRGKQVALKAWFEHRPAAGKQAAFAAWLTTVASLPPEQQVAAVAHKLKELNPGFDGQVTPRIEGGVVTELQFLAHRVTDLTSLRALPGLRTLKCAGTAESKGRLDDLTPLRGMNLTELDCNWTNVADLTPLKDMKLATLRCAATRVGDLSPLKDMNLTELDCSWTNIDNLMPLKGMKLAILRCLVTRVADLSPLKGMNLMELDCSATPVSTLAPLSGMKLRRLACNDTIVSDLTPIKDMRPGSLCIGSTRVTDLSVLKDMRLDDLDCSDTKVSDISPLKDMNLTALWCQDTQVTDLSPLQGMHLESIYCDFKPERHGPILRSMKTLQTINDKPVKDFWREVDAGKR